MPQALLVDTDILRFGSVSLTDDPSCTTVMSAVRQARKAGALITYDPDDRASLWPDEQTAIRRMRMPLDDVDVLKISDAETELMTGERDPALAAKLLMHKGLRLILVTLGARGVYYRIGFATGVVEGYRGQAADTNGAGDTFFGAELSRLSVEKEFWTVSAKENEKRFCLSPTARRRSQRAAPARFRRCRLLMKYAKSCGEKHDEPCI